MLPIERNYLTDIHPMAFYIPIFLTIAVFIALTLSTIDSLIISRILYKKSLKTFIIISIAIHVVLMAALITATNFVIQSALMRISGVLSIPTNRGELLVSTGFLAAAIVLGRFIIEVDKKLGPGNLWKLITGRFYQPREEERVFMFIDLRGATSIAEQIGHFAYSKFLQDCFNDLAIVDKFNANIYQYVGDEVIVTWNVSESKKDRRFLSAFFAFQDVLESRRAYYQATYNVFPVFKAGVHAGPVIITEVGKVKREITYHGDTMNTASRIQGMCNEMNALLLVSSSLLEIVKAYTPYKFQDVGEISLKGKSETVQLYNVTRP